MERPNDVITRTQVAVCWCDTGYPLAKLAPQRGDAVEAIAESLTRQQCRLKRISEPLEARFAAARTLPSTERFNTHQLRPSPRATAPPDTRQRADQVSLRSDLSGERSMSQGR